jgi:hypothetical protein
MSAGQFACECGCGRLEYFYKLKTFEIPIATDETLRRTAVARRFLVRKECLEDFIQELQALKLLTDITRRYSGRPFWFRIRKARQIVRLQFIINVRLKGVEETRRISLRSATMFALPLPPTSKMAFRVSRWLYRYWQWKDTHTLVWRQRANSKENAHSGSQAVVS